MSMRLPCGLGPMCSDFAPSHEHDHEHGGRCAQATGGIACPVDGKCTGWHEGAIAAGDTLRDLAQLRKFGR